VIVLKFNSVAASMADFNSVDWSNVFTNAYVVSGKK